MTDSLGIYPPTQVSDGREADGRKADISNIKKDDLEAASLVVLSPINGEGKNLECH